MIEDIQTVMWKEMKELLEISGGVSGGFTGGYRQPLLSGVKGGIVRLAIWIGIFGILFPLEMKTEWLSSPVALFYWSWFPLFVVSSVAAGAFAGERDQHTLETLLSSRLPDSAILFGKLGAGVVYGWGVTVVSMVLGCISVNLASGTTGGWQFYTPLLTLGGPALSLLTAVLAGGVGIQVALRAPSARQAQQTLSLATVFIFLVPTIAFQSLPAEVLAPVVAQLMQMSAAGIVLAIGGGLLLIDGALLAGVLARFRRSRLILD